MGTCQRLNLIEHMYIEAMPRWEVALVPRGESGSQGASQVAEGRVSVAEGRVSVAEGVHFLVYILLVFPPFPLSSFFFLQGCCLRSIE